MGAFHGANAVRTWEQIRNREQCPNLRIAQGPKVRVGSKTEVSGLARHVRFILRSRHRQPAPACPFGAKLRRKGSETGANFAVCGYYSHGYDCAAALLSELARLSRWTGPFRSQVVRVIPIE